MRKIMIAIAAVVAAATVTSIAACAADTESAGSNATTTTRNAQPTARGTPTPSTSPTPSAADQAKPETSAGCRETRQWNTADKTATPFSTDALYGVRLGRHDCYDRVVLDINGPAEAGYAVRYVPVVTADGSGKPMPVPGTAALEVVLHAPPQGLDNSGHQPGRMFANTGDYLYTATELAGWHSLRAIRFAGYFEGRSTLAIGISETLPFRVSTQLDATNHIRRIIIDITHAP